MGFLDFIFDNLFIVVIIVIGVLNFFNSIRKKEMKREGSTDRTTVDQRRVPPQQGRQSMENGHPKGQPLGRMVERVEKRMEDFKNQFDHMEESTNETLQEKQRAQYEKLRKNIQTQHASMHQKDTEELRKPIHSLVDAGGEKHKEKHAVSLELDQKLTPQGLIESVIMAEVLGPPRALNPYQNIAKKRMQR